MLAGCAALGPEAARRAQARGDFEGMRAICLAGAEGPEAPPWALGCLAQAELALGRPVEAERAYRRYLQAQPEDVGARLAVARIQIDDGRPEAARDSVKAALAVAPNNAEAHFLLGEAYRRAGACRGATTAYRRALALAPKHAQARAALRQTAQRCPSAGAWPAERESPGAAPEEPTGAGPAPIWLDLEEADW
jgi:tetratricopeptide (TPR) repeat protein